MRGQALLRDGGTTRRRNLCRGERAGEELGTGFGRGHGRGGRVMGQVGRCSGRCRGQTATCRQKQSSFLLCFRFRLSLSLPGNLAPENDLCRDFPILAMGVERTEAKLVTLDMDFLDRFVSGASRVKSRELMLRLSRLSSSTFSVG